MKRKQFKPVGQTKAICPYCGYHLEKMPARKKKCPNCGNFIYVRKRPYDDKFVLVTKDEAEIIEEQRSILYGTHDVYLANKARRDAIRNKLRRQYGDEPTDEDVEWHIILSDKIEAESNGLFVHYTALTLMQAEHLKKQNDCSEAIPYYLDYLYLWLNGPDNRGYFNPYSETVSPPPPGVINRIDVCRRRIGVQWSDVRSVFFIRADGLRRSLPLKLTPEDAWVIIENAIDELSRKPKESISMKDDEDKSGRFLGRLWRRGCLGKIAVVILLFFIMLCVLLIFGVLLSR